MSNNPNSTRQKTLEENLTIVTHNGCTSHKAGETVTMQTSAINQCEEPNIGEPESKSTKDRAVITIPAGENRSVAVPSPGATYGLEVIHGEPILYLTGTPLNPLAKPADGDIPTGAPPMATSGPTNINLDSTSDDPVNEVCIVNCSQVDQKIQLCWSGVQV